MGVDGGGVKRLTGGGCYQWEGAGVQRKGVAMRGAEGCYHMVSRWAGGGLSRGVGLEWCLRLAGGGD